MLVGFIGSIPVTGVAYFLSRKLGLRIATTTPAIETPEVYAHSTILIFIPLIIPIVLIALASLPTLIPVLQSWWLLQVIGNPAVALLIGLSFTFLLIGNKQKQTWPRWISEALKDAGIILLITGAGGAFGAVIKSSGLDLILKDVLVDLHAGGIIFILIAFILAAILKTAQGSSTSAIIITSSLLAPLTLAAEFSNPIDLATLVLAIGGGAMTVSHANDSYFWVVTQFSGIGERDAYKSYTLITLAQGLTALLVSIIIYLL
jgi:GntP family gluconate:H+ symporter